MAVQDENYSGKFKREFLKAPTIGFFINILNTNYFYPIWHGAEQAAARLGVNIFTFCGYALNTPDLLERPGTLIYEYADAGILDGLLIAGSLTVFQKDQSYFNRFKSIPKVVIAMDLDGAPSVGVDNLSGFRELLLHLIDDHGYRRIAYIGGPNFNKDAEQRFRIYRDVLTERSIPYDSKLVTPGQFHSESSGNDAIRLLLDNRMVDFDAVVAANDTIAYGAYLELTSRGIRVPEDIALTGFDDQEWAKYCICPLTTVRQSGFLQGQCSMEMLLDIIRGKSIPNEVLVPTELVNRHSCGCFSKAVSQLTFKPKVHSDKERGSSLLPNINLWRQIIVPEMIRAIGAQSEGLPGDWTVQLTDGFLSDTTNQTQGKFLKTLAAFLQQFILASKDPSSWQSVITVMRTEKLFLLGTKDIVLNAENLFHQARILIGEAAAQNEIFQGYLVVRKLVKIRHIIQAIESSFHLGELTKALDEYLPQLGIQNCYLSLYEGREMPASWSRLILSFTEDERNWMNLKGLRFPTSQIVPNELLPAGRYSLGIFPLFFREEQLGFIVYDMASAKRYAYDRYANETLHGIISSVTKRALLMEKLKEKEKQLEDNTVILININRELNQFAHLASSGLQEMLGTVSGYLRLMEEHYKGKLDATADQYIGYALESAERMQMLIDNLVNYSRVSNLERALEPVDLNETVRQVCINLRKGIEENQVMITYERLPKVMADPGQMVQLFENLIQNAIKFRNENFLKIQIQGQKQENGWLFSVQDNGIGLDMKYAERIFLIFHRLYNKRDYPGTGIGLSICKKIVERHGGRIWVQSEPGRGSTFYFTIHSMSR